MQARKYFFKPTLTEPERNESGKPEKVLNVNSIILS